jgi:hypothetical protein
MTLSQTDSLYNIQPGWKMTMNDTKITAAYIKVLPRNFPQATKENHKHSVRAEGILANTKNKVLQNTNLRVLMIFQFRCFLWSCA